ncbi:11060_t:CDS:2 [Ambispora leptoticha]|uniref:11060_t:CDS:1 n=1 Tax=Ambispora leptoticha TaxID=144679 RepID=A0A9N8W689_9GLOM|nr:11060_t:CDS:2 [Ambispora leptoticha]
MYQTTDPHEGWQLALPAMVPHSSEGWQLALPAMVPHSSEGWQWQTRQIDTSRP